MTEITAKSIDEALRKQLESLDTSVDAREVGTVVQVGDGIARVDGLKGAMAGELLEFIGEGGKTVYGLAQNLEEEEVGAVLLGDVTAIRENDQVHRQDHGSAFGQGSSRPRCEPAWHAHRRQRPH